MSLGDSWWFFGVLRGSCHFLMVFCCSRWFLLFICGSLYLLVFLGDYWWFFEVFGGSWHLLVVLKVLGCFCWFLRFLVVRCGFWCFLRADVFYGSW